MNNEFKTLQITFEKYLDELKEKKAASIKKLQLNFQEDEMIHAKVELNIINIFSKMFTVSCRKAKITDDCYVSLKAIYSNFFDTIPASWYNNLEKCKINGKSEEAYLEELKIAQMNEIKSYFFQVIE